jgi:hypothetical protein
MRIVELPWYVLADEDAVGQYIVDVPIEGDLIGYGWSFCNTVTDTAGITEGETWENWLERFEFKQGGKPLDTIHRNECTYLADLFGDDAHTDLTPTTATAIYGGYFFGFPKMRRGANQWQMVFRFLQLDSITSATDVSMYLYPFVIYGPISEAIRVTRTETAAAAVHHDIPVPLGVGPLVGWVCADNDNDANNFNYIFAEDGQGVQVYFEESGETGKRLYALKARKLYPPANVAATVWSATSGDAVYNRRIADAVYSGRIFLKASIAKMLKVRLAAASEMRVFWLNRYGVVKYQPGQAEVIVSNGVAKELEVKKNA